jgi:type I restriction enzyme, S subunit
MSKAKNKLMPDLRFPEFKNEAEWEKKKLGDCLDYIQPTDFLVSSTAYDNSFKTPVLTAGKTFILGYTNEVDNIFKEKLPVIIFDDFTTASQYVDFPFKAKSSAMKILLSKNEIDIKFSYEIMQMISYEVGVHGRHWISVFSNLDVPLPKNPNEQQKIASCLFSLDEVIETHRQKLDALKDHKKGLMQNLFPQEGATVPKYRFKEFKKDGKWVEATFGSAATFINGKAYKQEELLDKGKYKVLRVGNFFTNKNWYYSDLELEEDKYCDNGDLLYAWSASFGPRIWEGDKTIYHYHIWKVVANVGIDKSYLFKLLDNETERMKSQNANGFALLHITKGTIENWKCNFPKNEKEQQKIASCLASLDELITSQEKKIEQLKLHKKGLMQGLFPKMND